MCIFLLLGYLPCCRFLDDSQIITCSGDMTWYDRVINFLLLKITRKIEGNTSVDYWTVRKMTSQSGFN